MNINSDEGEEIKINPDFLVFFQDELNFLSRTVYSSGLEEDKDSSKIIKNYKNKDIKETINDDNINKPSKNINVDISKDEILYLKSIIKFFSNK